MHDACLAGLYVAKSNMADVWLSDFSMFEFRLIEFFLAGCCLADPSMIELRQADLCSRGGEGRCTWLRGRSSEARMLYMVTARAHQNIKPIDLLK